MANIIFRFHTLGLGCFLFGGFQNPQQKIRSARRSNQSFNKKASSHPSSPLFNFPYRLPNTFAVVIWKTRVYCNQAANGTLAVITSLPLFRGFLAKKLMFALWSAYVGINSICTMCFCTSPDDKRISPEKCWLEDYSPFEMIPLQVTFVNFGGTINWIVPWYTRNLVCSGVSERARVLKNSLFMLGGWSSHPWIGNPYEWRYITPYITVVFCWVYYLDIPGS